MTISKFILDLWKLHFMPLLTLASEDMKQLKMFELKCNTCGSLNCKIDIDWAAYPSASWNNVTVICNDCGEDETVYESN